MTKTFPLRRAKYRVPTYTKKGHLSPAYKRAMSILSEHVAAGGHSEYVDETVYMSPRHGGTTVPTKQYTTIKLWSDDATTE